MRDFRGRRQNTAKDSKAAFDAVMNRIVKPDPDPAFAKQFVHSADGESFVTRQAEARWDALNGHLVREAALACEETREIAEKVRKRFHEAEQNYLSLPRRIKMNVLRGADGGLNSKKSVPFHKWDLRDQIVCVSAGGMAVLLTGLGAVNVASTILSSGNPVFIEAPWMAWMVGALVPA